MSNIQDDDRADVIIRCHAPDRLNELERAVFSVVAQTAQPVTAHVVTQRFDDNALAATQARLSPLFAAIPGAELEIHNWREASPVDGRSCLINEGLRHIRGRYLSFLDYDDILFPEAHQILRKQLAKSGATIAFASVQTMWIDIFSSFALTRKRAAMPFGGSSILDLFHQNLAPVHSYLIDRRGAPPGELRFDEELTWEEDYEFLLRLCARVSSDFSGIGTFIGWYNFKTDGSNSIPTTAAAAFAREKDQQRVREELARRKAGIVLTSEVAAAVRAAAGLHGTGQMTAAEAAGLISSRVGSASCSARRSSVTLLARAAAYLGREGVVATARRALKSIVR
ncbi:glycosyltransferase family A protein [Bosea rubneri]|uniref:Glycosyltransferase family A protein n=1 Tax=Bosea rubneri TaxID=3075434 RepID=A0ABU3SFM8_9HYPH|nr:glycosyltransferase family A protein [Bosea sp. ZW T0_25]MDU0343595.1 glycosyltransferase family A protein [Bosea sp. ZW T0_25]